MPTLLSRRRALIRATALATLAMPVLSRANAQPLRSLQIVVPAPPGTQPDLIARWLIEPLAQRAGVPGLVLNRPGASGALAADQVLGAAPDSGSLLLGGLDHVAYSHVNNNRRALDPLSDFIPVGAVNRDTWLLVTAADSPLSNMTSLREAARQGQTLSYASTGEGSTAHLLTARLASALGLNATHVPYKESYQPDLIAGRVGLALAPSPAVLGPVRGGKLRALATLAAQRLAGLPDVPSVAELGLKEQVFYGGLYLFAPASLGAQVPRLNEWLVQAQMLPEVVERYRAANIKPRPLSPYAVRDDIVARLHTVDAMRLAVFGKAR